VDTISVSDIQTHSITLTETAAARVHSLLAERNLPDYALRLFVSGGGCSGLQYGMALEGQPREDDLRFRANQVDIVIDPVSIGYLGGCTVDYVDDLMGGGFKIDNPQAVASCGCGHSFRTSGQAPQDSSGGCGCG
jgi:iron-sulfur cluster assembly accessory protein